MRATGLLFASLLLLLGCPSGPEPEVTVVHRCGDLNMDALSGTFGRLEGDNNINSRFRLKFTMEDGKTIGRFVAGKDQRLLMDGSRTGYETMDLLQAVPRPAAGERQRRLQLSLSQDCRLVAEDGWVRSEGGEIREGKAPGKPMRFVPFDLHRLDFEPCTEQLHLKGAARNRAAARKARPQTEPTVITNHELPIGLWAPRNEIEAGCTAEVDLWVNGEAEAMEIPVSTGSGSEVHWTMDYDARYLGNKGLALHRMVRCEGRRRLLAVACANIEVK